MSSKATSRKSIKENDAIDLNNLREAVEHAIEVNDTASIVSSTYSSLVYLLWFITQHTEFCLTFITILSTSSVVQAILGNFHLLLDNQSTFICACSNQYVPLAVEFINTFTIKQIPIVSTHVLQIGFVDAYCMQEFNNSNLFGNQTCNIVMLHT